MLNRIFIKQWNRVYKVFRWLCTFGFINLTWLIFRAENLQQTKMIIQKVFAREIGSVSDQLAGKFSLMETELINYIFTQNYEISQTYLIYVFLIAAVLIVLCVCPYAVRRFRPSIWNYLGTMILMIWSILSLAGESDFIYFGF